MALTFNTDMKYTRSGEAVESNVLSAHDPLIWIFRATAIAANPTATVDIIAKDNLGAVVYASPTLDAYEVSYGGGVAVWRFDATEIIKHIINNYFFKESDESVDANNYGSYIEVTFKSYDDAVLDDTAVLEYFASHALNQIGDEYGSNIPRVFYNDQESIIHFLGYPTKVFGYSPDDISAFEPGIFIYESTPPSLITLLSNIDYDTFTVAGGIKITSAINLAGTAKGKSDQFATTIGDVIAVIIPGLTINSGEAPSIQLVSDGATVLSHKQLTVAGSNIYILVNSRESEANTELWITNGAAANWDTDRIRVFNIIDATSYGTLLQYFHQVNLYHLIFSKNIEQTVRFNFDLDVLDFIKRFIVTPIEPCDYDGYFIRWLNPDGGYSYWLFSPFPSTTREQQQAGQVINSFNEMALANSRHFPIGYRDSNDKILVASSSVPIAQRRKMMHLFISPAAYLWNGKPTEDQNLIITFENGTAPNDYDTIAIYENAIRTTYEAGGAAELFSEDVSYVIEQGEQVRVMFWLGLESGEVPSIVLVDSDGNAASNAVATANGYNDITLTATEEIDFKLKFYNTAACLWGTEMVHAVRKELETDWILLESVEGSHSLMEKKQFDTFECTLALPQNYTQQLSGQNI